MKVLRLTYVTGGGAYCIYDATDCPRLLEEITTMQWGEVSDEWKITLEEMKEEDFKNLPEFSGW